MAAVSTTQNQNVANERVLYGPDGKTLSYTWPAVATRSYEDAHFGEDTLSLNIRAAVTANAQGDKGVDEVDTRSALRKAAGKKYTKASGSLQMTYEDYNKNMGLITEAESAITSATDSILASAEEDLTAEDKKAGRTTAVISEAIRRGKEEAKKGKATYDSKDYDQAARKVGANADAKVTVTSEVSSSRSTPKDMISGYRQVHGVDGRYKRQEITSATGKKLDRDVANFRAPGVHRMPIYTDAGQRKVEGLIYDLGEALKNRMDPVVGTYDIVVWVNALKGAVEDFFTKHPDLKGKKAEVLKFTQAEENRIEKIKTQYLAELESVSEVE